MAKMCHGHPPSLATHLVFVHSLFIKDAKKYHVDCRIEPCVALVIYALGCSPVQLPQGVPNCV